MDSMDSWIKVLFMLGTVMFVGGFLMNTLVRKDTVTGKSIGISGISMEIACALSLIVVYAIIVVAADKEMTFIKDICSGIPFVDDIADFGGLRQTYIQNPSGFVVSFFELVLLTVVMDAVKKFFGVSKMINHIIGGKANMMLFFTYFVASLIGVFIFNKIVATSDTYAQISTFLGGLSTTVAIALLVVIIIIRPGYGLTKIFGDFFYGALFKSMFYVALILFLEFAFNGIENSVSVAINLLMGLGPILIMFIALIIIIKSVFSK